jgi:RNA polymerase sigma-70 factor (ECF subfamily)
VPARDDYVFVTGNSASARPGAAELLGAYDDALAYVYGYLISRCGQTALAEDLTSETFLAAADAVRGNSAPPLSRAWFIGIARHKLADHWRYEARERARVQAIAPLASNVEDPWDAWLERELAWQTLGELAPQHRAALTLRYVDDLPVPACAEALGRTLAATEALLTRAKAEFRRTYPQSPAQEGGSDD